MQYRNECYLLTVYQSQMFDDLNRMGREHERIFTMILSWLLRGAEPRSTGQNRSAPNTLTYSDTSLQLLLFKYKSVLPRGHPLISCCIYLQQWQFY